MLKVAVVGVGAMGRNHARIFAEMPQTHLAAVADVDAEAAAQVARTYKAEAYADFERMLAVERPDVVSVAVPTRLHQSVAVAVLEAGSHVFVEKPLALSVAAGQAILDAVHRTGRKLAVGHIERFNPAVVELKHLLDEGQLGRIFQLRSRRVGPFPPRVEDVGVVFDLATHEVNILEYLTKARVTSLYAETAREIHAAHEDLLSGVLKFSNGAVGVLDINWLTPKKFRELTIIGERGMFAVNYLTQELQFFENSSASNGQWEGLTSLMGVSEGRVVKYELKRKEPLRAEFESFIQAVMEDHAPLVDGAEGLRAVLLAEKIVESGLTHQIIRLA